MAFHGSLKLEILCLKVFWVVFRIKFPELFKGATDEAVITVSLLSEFRKAIPDAVKNRRAKMEIRPRKNQTLRNFMFCSKLVLTASAYGRKCIGLRTIQRNFVDLPFVNGRCPFL